MQSPQDTIDRATSEQVLFRPGQTETCPPRHAPRARRDRVCEAEAGLLRKMAQLPQQGRKCWP